MKAFSSCTCIKAWIMRVAVYGFMGKSNGKVSINHPSFWFYHRKYCSSSRLVPFPYPSAKTRMLSLRHGGGYISYQHLSSADTHTLLILWIGHTIMRKSQYILMDIFKFYTALLYHATHTSATAPLMKVWRYIAWGASYHDSCQTRFFKKTHARGSSSQWWAFFSFRLKYRLTLLQFTQFSHVYQIMAEKNAWTQWK